MRDKNSKENKEMKNLTASNKAGHQHFSKTVSFSRSGDGRDIRTEKLTEKEFKALETIKLNTDAPDDGQGLAWTQPSDLLRSGYSKHQTAGLWSSLMEKKIIEIWEERAKEDGGDIFVFDYNII